MAEYQIRELAHLTGVKAHTIRVWEQRYNLLEPSRTSTNIRFYDDDDLCLLLNVALLSEHGYRISRIAAMTPAQRAQEVAALASKSLTDQSAIELHAIQQLVLATIQLDEVQFEQALTAVIQVEGLTQTMLRVVYPFLERIGILWHTGTINPAQEHLISNLIRQKVIVEIDALRDAPAPDARRFVLFLPETELHELGLLVMHYLLRTHGQRVTYLGANLPARDLELVGEVVKPDYLLTVLTVTPPREEVANYVVGLAARNPSVKLLLYGNQVQDEALVLPDTALRFTQMTAFVRWLEENFPVQKP